MIEKNYSPQDIEQKYYKLWEDSGLFACDPSSSKPKYCIIMPPPNVTGRLHLGHALTFSLQDILVRYYRLKGFDVLWQPGTDHAGIATQMIVERQLLEKNILRQDLGREKFLEKVWEWKAESGSMIIDQLKRLGATPDWKRGKFTLDPDVSDAVRKVFVELYQQKLIYKDKRLVNWDIVLKTAVSDLETEEKEIQGNLYYINYKIENSDETICVATVRPETLFGDTAIAIHPDDERYAKFAGKFALVPFINRKIPIIKDDYCDPEKGTGAVKITPAHDFNDFEVGVRHNLERISVFDFNGCMNENAPKDLQGMDRLEARKLVVEQLETLGVLTKIEPTIHTVPHGDRSGSILEPMLTDQWYVDAATLAKPALEAVENGDATYIPKHWENTYFEWLRNIRPWCISRQIWWGHRIPAWYGHDGTVFVSETEDDALIEAEKHYGKPAELTQDTDVLDTWFSSALWPFTTLGWPDRTQELEKYYPTSVLMTGFDIIFFWVARMMMMGLHFMKKVPFEKIYIHALVRDEKGQKMSKTRGNILDPLELCDQYGADALRFTLASLAAPGRDISLSPAKVETSRNFITKLWNATRYSQMNDVVWDSSFDEKALKHDLNIWIFESLTDSSLKIAKAFEDFRFNEAANLLYQFIWGNLCDWYLELTKPLFQSGDDALVLETKKTLGFVLGSVYKILNPIAPHVSEELWASLSKSSDLLLGDAWPELSSTGKKESYERIEKLIEIITCIRSSRSELNVPASKMLKLLACKPSNEIAECLETFEALIKRMCRIDDIQTILNEDIQEKSAVFVVDGVKFALPLEGVIDFNQEKIRLQKELEKINKELEAYEKKLNNPSYMKKARTEVIEEVQEKAMDAKVKISKLQEALGKLS